MAMGVYLPGEHPRRSKEHPRRHPEVPAAGGPRRTHGTTKVNTGTDRMTALADIHALILGRAQTGIQAFS